MATKDELDLAQLADDYDILGQVGSGHGPDVALASRKADRRPVLITVYRELEGDEGNALNHLASDAKLLAGEGHPAIVPVLESRWVGNALAIVTDRIAAPSLEDRLSRREEEFPFPRIAALLRDVNALLEWARDRRIVNRGLDPASVFVDDASDRVRVMFVAQPLAANGIPDEHDDARTVATLARAMLTRSVHDPERDRLPLAELRPGLPLRVVQQAEALMGRAESIDPVDVRSFIAAIAMSEELRRGEDECARVTHEMSEEQRVTREALAAERKAHEDDLAEQARRFEQEKDAILKSMAREREETAKVMAKEREASAKQLRQERERSEKEMQRQRDAFDREMEKQRAALEKERVRITRARERMERDRERFEKERLAAETAMAAASADRAVSAEPPAATTAFLADPDLEDEVLPYEDVAEPRPVPEPVAAESARELEPVSVEAPKAQGGFAGRWAASPASPANGSRWRSPRVIGAAAVLLLLVIAVTALAIGGRGRDRTAQTLAANAPSEVRVVDSMSGLTVPMSPLDSAFLQDSISAASPVAPVRRRPAAPRPRPEVTVASPDSIGADTGTVPGTGFLAPVRDSSPLPPLPFTRSDSVVRQDTLLRRDTSQRRDTTVQRDSVVPRRDTSISTPPRPDSGAVRRNDR